MKSILILGLMALTYSTGYAVENGRAGSWTEVVDSPEGRYSLAFDPGKSSVDVTSLDSGVKSPSEMRIRIHRKNDRPLDLKLKTLDVPNEGTHYTGQLQDWKGSVMGFELEMSFDKKTWKKFKRIFGASK